MRERDELLREAEEEMDVGDRAGFGLEEGILVSPSADALRFVELVVWHAESSTLMAAQRPMERLQRLGDLGLFRPCTVILAGKSGMPVA